MLRQSCRGAAGAKVDGLIRASSLPQGSHRSMVVGMNQEPRVLDPDVDEEIEEEFEGDRLEPADAAAALLWGFPRVGKLEGIPGLADNDPHAPARRSVDIKTEVLLGARGMELAVWRLVCESGKPPLQGLRERP